MGRLFWKIFASFWIALTLIIGGVIWGTTLYLEHSDAFQSRDMQTRFAKRHAHILSQVLRISGPDAAKAIIRERPRRVRKRFDFYILDDQGNDLLGKKVDFASSAITRHRSVLAADGKLYHIASLSIQRKKPTVAQLFTRPFKRSPGVFWLWFAVALASTALVSALLASSMTRPIRRLQQATQKIAAGDLSTRVSGRLNGRKDEIGQLGSDFDEMAKQLQSQLDQQKQLLSDMSHELRSPLARLKVALGLAQQRAGDQFSEELSRIDHESQRLEEMIAQVLTLSRLEAGSVYRKDDFIEITEFLQRIIQDCQYEWQGSGKSVKLTTQASGVVEANAKLLRSALENILRNALRYTGDNTDVLVHISQNMEHYGDQLLISIRDHGPGVTEDKLSQLFDPFVRLSAARDRDSGGYGLGLAIAKRAIEFHQGSIAARNLQSGGLNIEIVLPITNIE